MCVVERVAVFPMLVEEEILRLVSDKMTGQNLGLRTVKGGVFVGVSHVACGRQQEKNVGGWALACRAHYEWHVVDVVTGLQSRRIDGAGRVFGDRQGEVSFPACIVEVVVVEMNGAVLTGSMFPIVLVA